MSVCEQGYIAIEFAEFQNELICAVGNLLRRLAVWASGVLARKGPFCFSVSNKENTCKRVLHWLSTLMGRYHKVICVLETFIMFLFSVEPSSNFDRDVVTDAELTR